jgi:UDP-glucose 4-epimerase
MNILVTGGGGYIGSFMVKALCGRGDMVYVLDNFKRGYKDAVDSKAQIFEGDLINKDFLKKTFSEIKPEAVIHFAGLISVAESVKNPGMYFESNVLGALNILEEIKEEDIKFIFSSTAAVYGNPDIVPIPEDHPKKPTSPYGMSKLMVEDILSWYNEIYGLPFVALRYFNASGAEPDGTLGERHNPETHIIPKAIMSLMEKSPFYLFGQDYKTPDGTCVRDYIHVLDLVDAHMLALDKMKDEDKKFYNVGTGKGYSNKQVIHMIEKVSGKKLEIINTERRPGDPDELVADPSLIKSELGFEPKHSELESIVKSAYLWYSKNKM